MVIAGILDLESARTAEFLARFSTAADEQQATRYKHPLPRRQSVAARALLRFLLAEALGPASAKAAVFDRAPNGKPLIDRAGLHIALSHSAQRVAAAVSDIGPIGIDIERIKPGRPIRQIIEFVTDAAAHADLSARDDDQLYRLWTILECLRKAIDIELPARVPPAFIRGALLGGFSAQSYGSRDLVVSSTIEDGYAVGLAVETSGKRIEVNNDWPAFMPVDDGLLIARTNAVIPAKAGIQTDAR